LYVGGGGKVLAEAGHVAPRLTDKMIEVVMFDAQQSDRQKPRNREDSLYAPIEDGEERLRKSFRARSLESSSG
jgi:hypothetical protein